MIYKEQVPCEGCDKRLDVDHTNRGYILRCRNPQCAVNEVRELDSRNLFIQRTAAEAAEQEVN